MSVLRNIAISSCVNIGKITAPASGNQNFLPRLAGMVNEQYFAFSLPGNGEAPAAPVFIDGKKAMTLRGARIAEEFVGILDDYVAHKYAMRAD